MNYSIIPAALIITVILVFIISAITKKPIRSFWLFFVVVFLATWSGQLWINPFGPRAWGISWLPLLIVALFFSFFILALIPPVSAIRTASDEPERSPFIIAGMFFWLIVVILFISIVIGYYRSPVLI